MQDGLSQLMGAAADSSCQCPLLHQLCGCLRGQWVGVLFLWWVPVGAVDGCVILMVGACGQGPALEDMGPAQEDPSEQLIG